MPKVRLNRGFLAALAALLMANASHPLLVHAQHPTTLIRNARIFDGERVIDAKDILIRDGLIVRIGTGLEAPADAEVVDAAGRTLMPGLIDAHTHTFGEGLEEAAVFGVTTHLDMFTDPAVLAEMRAEQAAWLVTTRAELYSAGVLVTAPGGHGTQYGMPIPTLSSAESAQEFVDARLAEGSDWIKIVLDDFQAYGMSMPTLDTAVVRAVIEATRRRDRLAVVHVGDAAGAHSAIDAGAHGLVHLFTDRLPDPDFAERVAERGAFVIPTLTVVRSIAGTPGGEPLIDDARLAPYLHPTSRMLLSSAFPMPTDGVTRSYDVARETTRRLHAAGVPILAGTDAANPGTAYGAAMHRELELLVEAGLSPAEALAAATSVPARIFGLDDRGRIEPGLRADLVLVDGDPTREITATRAIVGVWKSGTPIDRDAFAARVAAALDAERRRATPEDLADGRISAFESGSIDAAVGMWIESSDVFSGGNSAGSLDVTEDGAGGSGHALRIAGTIGGAVPFAWYGAMWAPGAQPMQPEDLSAFRGVVFQARGDGGTYRILVFSQRNGMTAMARTFEAGPEWREFAFDWSEFRTDGSDVMAVVLVGGPTPGDFEFLVDDFGLLR